MLVFPPSPAASACDSLADIEDLDAFFEGQGQLSHWPTPPPPKDDIFIEVKEVEDDREDDELDCKFLQYRGAILFLINAVYHIARVLTQSASIGAGASELDIRMVRRILGRAELPVELLCLSFNILGSLSNRISLPSTPSDLLVVSALSLAVSYTSDNPPSISHWSHHVCDGTWTAARIDKTSLQVLAALDWRLHELSHPRALQTALSGLTTPISMKRPSVRVLQSSIKGDSEELDTNTQSKVVIDGNAVCWVNGQVTPEGTPPSSALEEFRNGVFCLV